MVKPADDLRPAIHGGTRSTFAPKQQGGSKITSTRVFHLKVQSLFIRQSIVFSKYFRQSIVFSTVFEYFGRRPVFIGTEICERM